jgi:hypothetical protein
MRAFFRCLSQNRERDTAVFRLHLPQEFADLHMHSLLPFTKKDFHFTAHFHLLPRLTRHAVYALRNSKVLSRNHCSRREVTGIKHQCVPVFLPYLFSRQIPSSLRRIIL